jgi:hypothetical protein
MWSLGASLGIIVGVYFVLNGLSRFVEESYRGEPQTPIVGGMRIYQWTAIVSVSVGVAFTIFPAVFSVGFAHNPALPGRGAVITAILFALLCGFAMGVDFPTSNRRFARLASA